MDAAIERKLDALVGGRVVLEAPILVLALKHTPPAVRPIPTALDWARCGGDLLRGRLGVTFDLTEWPVSTRQYTPHDAPRTPRMTARLRTPPHPPNWPSQTQLSL